MRLLALKPNPHIHQSLSIIFGASHLLFLPLFPPSLLLFIFLSHSNLHLVVNSRRIKPCPSCSLGCICGVYSLFFWNKWFLCSLGESLVEGSMILTGNFFLFIFKIMLGLTYFRYNLLRHFLLINLYVHLFIHYVLSIYYMLDNLARYHRCQKCYGHLKDIIKWRERHLKIKFHILYQMLYPVMSF